MGSRSRSKPEKDRKPLVDREGENRKKEKKSRKRSESLEEHDVKTNKDLDKEHPSSVFQRSMSPSKNVSGRKSRIDSGISTGTNFSKGSISISPREERERPPKKEPLVVNHCKDRKERTRSPRRDRAGSPLRPVSRTDFERSPRREKYLESPHHRYNRRTPHSPSP